MQVLLCLASRAGRPVSREELMRFAWSDVVVGDDALNAAISKLRRLFEDDPRSPRFIETVPKVGYRLIAPVERDGEAQPLPRRPLRASVKPARIAAAAAVLVVIAAVALLVLRREPRSSTAAQEAIRMLPLTSDPGIEVQPAISPGTGERVAYAWKGPAGDDWSIWVRTLGVGEPLQLTRGAGSDHHPTWSPDGRWIAFTRTEDRVCSLMRVPALGGEAERVGACSAPVHDLDWSPDGRLLAWSEPVEPGAPHRIVLLELQSGRKSALTVPDPRSVGDLAVAFAPDGTRVGFIRSPALGVEEVWLTGLHGASPRRVTELGGKIHGFDWATDTELLVSSNRGGLFALWSVPAGGGDPVWITGGPSDINAPSAGAGGRSIAFEQWSDEVNLHEIDLRSGEARTLVASSRWDWDPTLSPDGSRLAFVSDRSGSSEIWIADMSGVNPMRRTSFGGPYVTRPRWSPDGRTLVFDARADGVADIWTMPAAGGAPRRITDDAAQDLAPFWSPDGQRIFFGSNRGAGWAIWSVRLDGSDAREHVPGGWVGEWTASGDLLYTLRGEPGLWIAPADGSTAKRIVDDLAPVDALTWCVRDGAVYHVRRDDPEEPVLVRTELSDLSSRELAPLGPILRQSALAITPDGARAILARVARLESDIVVLQR